MLLVALPLLAAVRATLEFFSERIELQPWAAGPGGPVPVEVEIEHTGEPAPSTDAAPAPAD